MRAAEHRHGNERQTERRAKPARRSLALYRPGPPLLKGSTKESMSCRIRTLWWQLPSRHQRVDGRCFLRSQPRRRHGPGHPLGRDPSRTTSTYHGLSDSPVKTGHFYFAGNRTFLFCLDRSGLFQDAARKAWSGPSLQRSSVASAMEHRSRSSCVCASCIRPGNARRFFAPRANRPAAFSALSPPEPVPGETGMPRDRRSLCRSLLRGRA